MKYLTLQLHDVASEGLPKESHENVLVVYPAGQMVVSYSDKHKAFCCHDNATYSSDELQHRVNSFCDVSLYAIIPNLSLLVKGGETP